VIITEKTSAYRTAIERTIEEIFYHKRLTPAKQKCREDLLKGGWVEEEKGLWFHAISEDLGDIYASLQKVVEEIRTEKMFERIGKIGEEGNSTGRRYSTC
jgi:hypothetical protein